MPTPAGGLVGPPVLGHHDHVAGERAGEVIAVQLRAEPRTLIGPDHGVPATRDNGHDRVPWALKATATWDAQPFCMVGKNTSAPVPIEPVPLRARDRPESHDLLIAWWITHQRKHDVSFAQRPAPGHLRDNLTGIPVFVWP